MRWYWCCILVSALMVAGLAGPCVEDVPCRGRGVPTDEFWVVICCTWDWGCWLNPFEPDGQWWCQTIQWYNCPDGSMGFETISAGECGPCCDPARPAPFPVVPIPTPVP
ncbi:MAG: hypothetical protein KatS3mg019_0578 [Fimbriimonadales bacterium]|nr:MAG: hypothetical protein KatS3mg019_0578 [Fimbriimonadales bacterium]